LRGDGAATKTFAPSGKHPRAATVQTASFGEMFVLELRSDTAERSTPRLRMAVYASVH